MNRQNLDPDEPGNETPEHDVDVDACEHRGEPQQIGFDEFRCKECGWVLP